MAKVPTKNRSERNRNPKLPDHFSPRTRRQKASIDNRVEDNDNSLPSPERRRPGGSCTRRRRILDFTHVQSGPTCTQLLAWFGADVIKVERPGVGDITRGQLVDVNADSLYFTMLNHNKRSITIDSKNKKGKEFSIA
jgi:formyl-CoA transferase